MSLDPKLLEVLACPKCKGNLDYKDAEKDHSLTCKKCSLKYPVVEDIPVMLEEEAEKI